MQNAPVRLYLLYLIEVIKNADIRSKSPMADTTVIRSYNLPYTHTALCEDHTLFQVLCLLVSSCRECRSPLALNHRNPCHRSHSVGPPPQAYTHTAHPQAHRTG